MLIDIFAIKYYKVSWTGSTEELVKVTDYAKQIMYQNWDEAQKNTHPTFVGNSVSTVSVQNSKSRIQTDPKFALVTKWILNHSAKFAQSLGYDFPYQNTMMRMWVNSYEQAGSINKHTHAPAFLSGVFNLQKTAGQSNLVFNHPLTSLLAYQPFKPQEDESQEWFTHEVDSQTGDLMLWPGWLEHHTRPNQLTTPKIGIGFEIG
jgi:uncharacterized protein (TIGR02466 family)